MEQSGRQTKHFSITINIQAGFQFLQHLFSSMAPWGGPMVDVEEKMFEIQVCRLRENPFSRIFMGILKIIHTCFCMRVCKYLNQRVRRRGKQVRNSFKGASKTKKKKNTQRLSFITQFKMEFLLPFTGCGKVLGKMPGKNHSIDLLNSSNHL